MRIDGIYSMREHRTKVYSDIVYEWEEELAKRLNVPILQWGNTHEVACRLIGGTLDYAVKYAVFGSKRRYLRFVMNAMENTPLFNHPTCIPIIIDFFVSDDRIGEFISIYERCEYVFISSKEAFDRLSVHNLPFEIRHFPLFVPERIRIRFLPPKKYSLTVFGAQINDAFFMPNIYRYAREHDNFIFVSKLPDCDKYADSNGNIVADASTREGYLELMRKSKVVVYSTPGIRGRSDANGYNQVTPKFLEYLSAYCHVILRYSHNTDTEFYELDRFGASVSSYAEFAAALDNALSSPIPKGEYDTYLSKHGISSTLRVITK